MRGSFYPHLLALSILLTSPLWAQAGPTGWREYQTGLIEFQGDFNYFSSSANYLNLGSQFDDLPGGGLLAHSQLDLRGRWLPIRNLGLFTGLQFSHVATSRQGEDRTNGGLNLLEAGADYLLWEGFIELAPQIALRFPLFRVNTDTQDAIYGHGATEIHLRLLAQKRLPRFVFYGFGGYTHRDQGLSGYLDWGGGAELRGQWLNLGAELRGQYTVMADQNTDTPSVRHDVLEEVNAGSFRFYSVNPDLIELPFWGSFDLNSQLRLSAGAVVPINGANAAQGWTFFTGITLRSAPAVNEYQPSQSRDQQFRFQEDTRDGVDHQIFERDFSRPPRPAPSRRDTQEDLDALERELEGR